MHTYSSGAQLLQLAVMSDLFVLELEVVPKYNTSKQAISVYGMYVYIATWGSPQSQVCHVYTVKVNLAIDTDSELMSNNTTVNNTH